MKASTLTLPVAGNRAGHLKIKLSGPCVLFIILGDDHRQKASSFVREAITA